MEIGTHIVNVEHVWYLSSVDASERLVFILACSVQHRHPPTNQIGRLKNQHLLSFEWNISTDEIDADVPARPRGRGTGVRTRQDQQQVPAGLRQGALQGVHPQAVPHQEGQGPQAPPVAELRHAQVQAQAPRLGDVRVVPDGEIGQSGEGRGGGFACCSGLVLRRADKGEGRP